jgi:hypothetical protein
MVTGGPARISLPMATMRDIGQAGHIVSASPHTGSTFALARSMGIDAFRMPGPSETRHLGTGKRTSVKSQRAQGRLLAVNEEPIVQISVFSARASASSTSIPR